MAQDAPQDESPAGRGRLRSGCLISLGLLALLLAAFALAWANREAIADDVLSDLLRKQGIRAEYTIESIGTRRQVLRDIVVGDPARPDLTVERAELTIEPRFGFPRIGTVRLLRPRLYGSYRGGELSFGALDPVLFAESDAPFELPDIDLAIEDGRALVESDHGDLGAWLTGSGNLRGGFAGELGAVAPRFAAGGCRAERATLYGKVTVADRRPGLSGPLRLSGLACGEGASAVSSATAMLSLRALPDLAGVEGDARLGAARLSYAGNRLDDLRGTTRFTWREGGLTARYDLTGNDAAAGDAGLAELRVEGSLRALRSFERIELVGSLNGRDLAPGAGFDAAFGDMARAGEGTLLAPIARRVASALRGEAAGSRITADYTIRHTDGVLSMVVPTAILRGRSGESLAHLSRLQMLMSNRGVTDLSGNFVTGGRDLPRITGRVEQSGGGPASLRMAMAPYAAGDAQVAVPELTVRRQSGGALVLAGEVRASGALPGGRVSGLVLPLSGDWSPAGGLALWRGCADIRFDTLELANLSLDRRQLALCPPRGSAILRHGAGGLRLAAGVPALDVTGRLGETPIAIRSGPVGLAYPGALSARSLSVTLGLADTATSFAIEDLSARIGADIAGRFSGTDVLLNAVPLDVRDASGAWRYADGRLTLTEGAFRVEDRNPARRFEPLAVRGATLDLEDNRIAARALLREPRSDAPLARVELAHDLATARGHADLFVDGLTFSRDLQPTQLTGLALGVVANMRGTVAGRGRIDWTEEEVTSSGRFSSESLDLAAAFGPVRGAAGTVEFTDLLALTTAPTQELRVASINPGIEVFDGVIRYSLSGGELLRIESAAWPFLGGGLTMRPIDIRFGEAEIRYYIFEVEGLEAARFVERMELNNLGATGVFDGTVPVVFDAMGNGRLEGGLLLSRPPGGNVSYVGELTYEDLSPMANYAFDMLRSLDYRQMSVQMDGPLIGEIVTRVRFDGVSQGEGARRNFLSRQIASLPIRFDVNVHAPFYSLIGSMRALYDPAAIRDPRELGLLDETGQVLRRESDGRDDPIQPRASEDVQ